MTTDDYSIINYDAESDSVRWLRPTCAPKAQRGYSRLKQAAAGPKGNLHSTRYELVGFDMLVLRFHGLDSPQTPH